MGRRAVSLRRGAFIAVRCDGMNFQFIEEV